MNDISHETQPAPSALSVEIESAVERAVTRALSKLASGGLARGAGQLKPHREVLPENRAFVDYHKAGEMTGLSRTTILRAVNEGTFPAPIKHGRRTLFQRTDIEGWIAARLAERKGGAAA